jgi:hypothetical protein
MALLIVAPLALGGSCGGSGGGSRDAKNSGPTAALRVEPAQVVYFAGGYYLKVDVYVSTNDPVQAWDITLGWNTANLDHLATDPTPEFDDDGVFFQSVLDADAGTLTLVDLRHTSEISGDLRIAQMWLVAGNGGTANVTVQGAVTDGAGTPFDIVANTNGTFPITP